MIHDLILNEGMISWKVNNDLIKIEGILVSAIVLEGLNQVLAIDEKNKMLILFNKDGKKLWEVKPPTGYDFSYVTYHSIGPVVVCSKDDNHGWEDWNFFIDFNTGELKKYGKAY